MRPRNAALLRKRDELQAKIDAWHREHPAKPVDLGAYTAFLREIGYLLPEGPDFAVGTTGVDAEIARIAGPQLVVPVSNARYALNAANARWGSLYDALYGTDAIPETDGAERGRGYNPARGRKVIEYARGVLDRVAPLAGGASHRDAAGYAIVARRAAGRAEGRPDRRPRPPRRSASASKAMPRRPPPCCSSTTACTPSSASTAATRSARTTRPGSPTWCWKAPSPPSWIARTRSPRWTPTTRSLVYRNWLGLMRGDLEASFEKGGGTTTRRLNPDRTYKTPAGGGITLHGRSLMLVRNVGHHMMTDAVTLDGQEVPETILDAACTAGDRAARPARPSA